MLPPESAGGGLLPSAVMARCAALIRCSALIRCDTPSRLANPSGFIVSPSILAAIGVALLAMLGLARSAHASDPESGTQTTAPTAKTAAFGQSLYQQHCVSCHGNKGEGTEDNYPESLVGDASVGELAEIIADTMPEEDPDLVVGDDAMAVAEYIHEQFYSPAAQLRNRPPARAFSRLTSDQLRQSIADLYNHGGWSVNLPDERGLKARYLATAKLEKDKDGKEPPRPEVKRTDAKLDFDFGKESPAEGIPADSFRIDWTGSIVPPISGRYELVLQSTCSCTLYFERNVKLVDNHVQSAGKEEFRRPVYLIGGRPYPMRLEFHQRERKTEQPPAKVSLRWVPPGGVEETIPTHCLSPQSGAPLYTIQCKLPPDDRSYGYARGTSIDRAWDQSTTQAALEFGPVVASELYPKFRRQAKKRGAGDEDRAILRDFLKEFVAVAFRGSLDDSDRARYIDASLAASEDDQVAIRRTVLMTVKSPRFLYPELDGSQSPRRRVINRLALVLFDSLPADRNLIQAIEKDQPPDFNELQWLSRSAMNDVRTTAKIRRFLYHWLDLDGHEDGFKDPELYPGFDAQLVQELHQSLDQFLDHVVKSEQSDFRELVAADWTMTADRLAKFYGDAWQPDGSSAADRAASAGDEPAGAPEYVRSVRNRQIHVGALTHPLLTSRLAYHQNTSPIHRGVFLIRHMLGRVLRPPNLAFAPLDPQLHPGLTTRQRVELQTGEASCQVCHSKINGLGFALEQFDAVGRFREREFEKIVDPSGSYYDSSGRKIEFRNARELGDYLAGSDDAARSFVETAFEYFVKQPPAAFGSDVPERLLEAFKQDGYHVRRLIVHITTLVAADAANIAHPLLPTPEISQTAAK